MSMVFILITHCVREAEDIQRLISEHLCWSAPSGFKAKELQIIDKEAGIIILIKLMCPKN